jgi:DNA repair exonuclease SbcCD ATPase subunit
MNIIDIFRIGQFKSKITELQTQNNLFEERFKELDADTYFQVKSKVEQLESEFDSKNKELLSDFESQSQRLKSELEYKEDAFNKACIKNNEIISVARSEVAALQEKEDSLNKQLATNRKKLDRMKALYKRIEHTIDNFISTDFPYKFLKLSPSEIEECESLTPSVMLQLHNMNMKDLRTAYRKNEKQIDSLLSSYETRYTTKANKSIYSLMVIALRAELQNILYNLKYEKLEAAIDQLKNITSKYLHIAGEGNQTIAGTLTKFIGEVEYLFINAIKIEYNYYVKKEQARQEQLAIRAQMKQEAEERKALERERQKIELEEEKFQTEISKLTEQIAEASDSELQLLKDRITELQSQLADVVLKKNEIAELQNGKAGNVYVISNLGSFGEGIFKIGMTRRMNPQDRVNELGDASVPFKFDVHCFIFSKDAVSLESELHKRLSSKRVNKLNGRKEFFYTSIDELETLVNEIAPTAEFVRTMTAEDYRQSLSTDEVYTTDFSPEDNDDE